MQKMVNDWNQKIFECDKNCLSDKRGGNIGNIDSEILFIAQTPGQQKPETPNEDIVPFGFYKKKEDKVKSEVVFHWMIELLGLTEKDFYLTNVVKCATNEVPNLKVTEICVNKFLLNEIKRMRNLKYIICMGEQAKAFVAYFKDQFDANDKYKYFFIWHPSFLSRNGFVDDINRKYGNETIFNNYRNKIISIKEVFDMSEEKGVVGKDVELGKVYKTVGRGTVVKITKIEKKGDKLEIFGITHPKFSLVTVPLDMRLIEAENQKEYDFSGAESVADKVKEEKKEEKKAEAKEEKEEKKEPKEEKKDKEEKKEEKKEKAEGKGTRKGKIDRKETEALYKAVKAHLEKVGGTKVNKNYVVFKIDDIKCRLYAYDCMVLADKKIKDIEPMKKFDDYVKYPVQDLFKVIGYKG